MPTSQNGQTHSNNLSEKANQLYECVWPFCGLALKGLRDESTIQESLLILFFAVTKKTIQKVDMIYMEFWPLAKSWSRYLHSTFKKSTTPYSAASSFSKNISTTMPGSSKYYHLSLSGLTSRSQHLKFFKDLFWLYLSRIFAEVSRSPVYATIPKGLFKH